MGVFWSRAQTFSYSFAIAYWLGICMYMLFIVKINNMNMRLPWKWHTHKTHLSKGTKSGLNDMKTHHKTQTVRKKTQRNRNKNKTLERSTIKLSGALTWTCELATMRPHQCFFKWAPKLNTWNLSITCWMFNEHWYYYFYFNKFVFAEICMIPLEM